MKEIKHSHLIELKVKKQQKRHNFNDQTDISAGIVCHNPEGQSGHNTIVEEYKDSIIADISREHRLLS